MSRQNYRKIYEQYHGSIPVDAEGRSYDIHHIDGDHTNNSIENLIAVPIHEHYNIHKAQKDWGSCWSISLRMDMSAAERSELGERAAKVKFSRGKTHAGKSNPHYNKNIYTFYHSDGRTFTGTRYDFLALHPIGNGNLSSMITGNRTSQNRIIRQVKGWRIKT